MANSALPTNSFGAGILLPGEDPDLRREAGKIFADPEIWLDSPHPGLAGRSPRDLLRSGQEMAVRNLLRSITYTGIS